jgi:hypothetical protein
MGEGVAEGGHRATPISVQICVPRIVSNKMLCLSTIHYNIHEKMTIHLYWLPNN